MRKVEDCQIVGFIRDFVTANGYCPSVREVMVGVGLNSPASMEYRLAALQKRGVVARTPGISRSLRVVENSDV